MKKILKVLSSIFILCLLILVLNGCKNIGVNGTYYELKGTKLDMSSYFIFKNGKWSADDETSGTYKIDGDKIVLYISFFGDIEELESGTISNGVIKFEELGTYCKEGKENDYINAQTELKFKKQNKSYIVTGVKNKDLKTINIPSTYNNLPITKIDDYAFQDCTSLTRITIPSSVKSIGQEAFYNCPIEYANIPAIGCSKINNSSLKEVVINSGGYILSDAFKDCKSLTNITISSSVGLIGEDAFYNCTSLTEVNYLGTIKDWCNIQFSNSSSNPLYYAQSNALRINGEEVTEITEEMLDGVTSIPDCAFYGCTSLTSITIPSSVESIGGLAFCNCKSLKSITIPSSVKSIGKDAFRNCTSLTSITIPSSVTSIGKEAFYNCTSLTKITIPSSVKSIGSEAFYGCTSLTEVNYLGTIKDWCNIEFSNYRSNPLCYAKSNALRINGKEVTEITEEMLEGVRNIPSGAFCGCTSLTNVTIPSSVQSIGDYTFSHCTSLTNIIIPSSVTSIGKDAFRNCTSLTSITIPSSVKSIGDCTFSHCTSLTNIIIPSSVTSIGACAFNGCTSLTSITIPSSVESIGDNAFEDCTSLTNIIIPLSVQSIGEYAFRGCTSLTIYCESDSRPDGWVGTWHYHNIPVYWKNRWHYENGTPTPNK